MTTLSKEDVVRLAAKAHAKGFHCGPPMEAAEFFTLTQLQYFAEAVSADLVAENERLEDQVLARDAELWGSTQEILALKAENGRLKAIIEKQSDCEGEFCGKCYEQGLSESRTALAAAEARETKLRNHLSAIPDCMYRDNAREIVRQALSQPRDDSALREILKEAKFEGRQELLQFIRYNNYVCTKPGIITGAQYKLYFLPKE